MRRRRPGAVETAAALLFLAASAARAQATDVVVLMNGDRVTGEIKSYSEGRLLVDTFLAGDVSVKWNRIVSVASDKQFEVQTTDGAYHYGMLAPSTPPGKLDIVDDEATRSFEFLDVVRLTPLYATFWRRIDGSLDLGFNYTQANEFFQLTFNFSATVRKPAFALSAAMSAFFTSQQGVPSSQRGGFSTTYQKFYGDRWSLIGGVGLNRNLDLGLDLRISLSGGAGRDIIRTNRTTFATFAGLTGSHEQPVAGADTYSLAAFVAGRFTTFTYDFPKLTVSAQLAVVPYLTDSGRIRLDFEALAKREIIHNFYLSLSLFDSFDSRDPTTQQSKNDWGPVLSIGWTF